MKHFIYKETSPHLFSTTDPRVKLLSGVALLVMVVSAEGCAFPLLAACLGLGLCRVMGAPVRVLVRRFAEPLCIACMIVLLKTLFSGEEALFSFKLFSMEVVTHRDGLMAGLLIASRIVGAVSIVAAVGFSTPFTELLAALSWMRVPRGFIEVTLFAWRYLFVIFDDALVIYHAQKNRLGYAGYRQGLRSFGALAGALVIKAFDSSQSITTAMVQRGYEGSLPLLQPRPLRMAELAMAVFFVAGMGFVRSL